MREINKVAEALFEKIRARFEDVSIGDENANSTQDPESARFFNFNYSSTTGEKFGNITVSLIDENSLKVYFSKDLAESMDDDQRNEWYKFLQGLRMFAKRNLLTFDTRDITRSNLQVKDLKQQSKSDTTLDADDLSSSVTESRMYGTSYSSYDKIGPAKIIVRHSAPANDEVRGSRSRHISNIFVETHEGERFKLPVKNLHYARAMARHVANGGTLSDETGAHLTELANEMSALRGFVRGTKNRQFEDAETVDMVEAACGRYNEVRHQIKMAETQRGYEHFKESVCQQSAESADVDLDAMRERFVKKTFDDRLSEALPYVYAAYQNRDVATETDEFEDWANSVVEDAWMKPDSDEQIETLQNLINKAIHCGVDGQDAINVLNGIIGDEDLYDQFTNIAKTQGPDVDVRPLIQKWLQDNDPEALAKLKFGADTEAQSQTLPAEPAPVPATGTQYGATGMDEPNVESADPLDFIRSLAGLKK